MSDKTGIEWTDATWNPVTGCTKVSAGCDHCYAETFAERFRGTEGHYFERGFDVQLRPDKLDLPVRWLKPKRVFVNSMSDLFHDQVPDDYIAHVFAVMADAGQHTFQVLTKRHARMRSLLSSDKFQRMVHYLSCIAEDRDFGDWWPLPNVWLGVSTEDQQWADIRIPALLDTPAAVRFISAEPLLGPINLGFDQCDHSRRNHEEVGCWRGLDWVIAGGESGHGARPMHPDWVRTLRDQCVMAGVPFMFKQQGQFRWTPMPDDDAQLYVERETGRTATDDDFWNISSGHWWGVDRVGKGKAGRILDGRTWDEYPEAVS